jgi:hypothetical protein
VERKKKTEGELKKKKPRDRRTAENEDRGRTRIANYFPCFFLENRDEGK